MTWKHLRPEGVVYFGWFKSRVSVFRVYPFHMKMRPWRAGKRASRLQSHKMIWKEYIPIPREIATAICRRYERRPTGASEVSRKMMWNGYKCVTLSPQSPRRERLAPLTERERASRISGSGGGSRERILAAGITDSHRIRGRSGHCVDRSAAIFHVFVLVAQLDRASASGAEGFAFESRRGYSKNMVKHW